MPQSDRSSGSPPPVETAVNGDSGKGGPAPLTGERKGGGFKAVVEGVKDLKEIVAALVLLGGGLTWVATHVATKTQVAEVRCLMQAQIDLLRSQTAQNQITTEMVDVGTRLKELAAVAVKDLSDSQRKASAALEVQLEALKKQRSDAEVTRRDVDSMLQRSGCAH